MAVWPHHPSTAATNGKTEHPVPSVGAPRDVADGRGDPSDHARDDAQAIVSTTAKATFVINFLALLSLAAVAVLATTFAVVYTREHGDEISSVLRDRAAAELGQRLLALLMPVALLVFLAAAAGIAAWLVHERNMEERYRTVDALNRIRREGEVAVPARALMVAFEQKFESTRKAFSLLLWLGRTLFIVSLGLFALAVINAVVTGVNLFTVVLGATSIAGALFGVANEVPRHVRDDLADVIQIQTIVTGCDRQISLLESHAIALLDRAGGPRQAALIHDEFMQTQAEIDRVVGEAVNRVQQFTEGASRRPRITQWRFWRPSESDPVGAAARRAPP